MAAGQDGSRGEWLLCSSIRLRLRAASMDASGAGIRFPSNSSIIQMTEAFRTAPENDTPGRGRPPSLPLNDMFAMWLMECRCGYPYYAMAHMCGTSNGSAQREVLKMRDCFNAGVGRRLFYLQDAATVRDNRPDDWPERFSDVLLIGDGVPRHIKKSGIFIIQRITWSPYKHDNIFLWVICTFNTLCGPKSRLTSPL